MLIGKDLGSWVGASPSEFRSLFFIAQLYYSRVSNEEAIRFYRRYGFETSTVLPRFYTDGEDGYKMFKHL